MRYRWGCHFICNTQTTKAWHGHFAAVSSDGEEGAAFDAGYRSRRLTDECGDQRPGDEFAWGEGGVMRGEVIHLGDFWLAW